MITAFGDEGAAALLTLIIAINTWNTIGMTIRCWPTTIRSRDQQRCDARDTVKPPVARAS